MIRRLPPAALALAALGLLTACGGGGGEGGGGERAGARNAAFTADGGQAVAAGRLAARSAPRSGSVRQSGGSLSPVAGVTVRRLPDGSSDIVVERRDGTRTSLNTVRHAVATRTGRSPAGRRAEPGTLPASDATRITAAAGLADRDPDDLADRIAGGCRLHVTGDREAGAVTGAEAGAFVEGPELADNAPPAGGTAGCDGPAAGLRAARCGTGTATPLRPGGTVETGDCTGRFRAAADFAAGTVSGTIGRIRVAGVGETPSGRVHAVPLQPGNVRVELQGASIDASGRATGTVRLVSLDPDIPFTSQEGSWGGRLSSVDDGAGVPRALAGTRAGRAATAGGTEVAYIGAHAGATGDF